MCLEKRVYYRSRDLEGPQGEGAELLLPLQLQLELPHKLAAEGHRQVELFRAYFFKIRYLSVCL